MIQGSRRDRSRSPHSVETVGSRRDINNKDNTDSGDIPNANLMNHMLMYQQGNVMMAGSMYPNMMMSGPMITGGIIPSTGIELVASSTIDMSTIGTQNIVTNNTPTMDMSIMGGMMLDPSIIGMYSGVTGEISTVSEMKEMVLKHCRLIPPDSSTPKPPCRTKPLGCRTIFVGGLPDNIRESIVKEIFEMYGRIHTLRLSKKHFCHIRYDTESSVDAAIAISGYRIKLIKDKGDNNDDDNSYTTSGWLQVDYALSRDDQNEYERRQRQAIRVQKAKMEQLNAQQEIVNRNMGHRRSHSPVTIQPFSNGVIVQLAERIKSEEHFGSTLPTLLAWLERGECSKKNSNQFYSMIQTTNSHIRRLFNEKMQSEEELNNCKERVKNKMEQVIKQFEQVAKVFTAATHKRVWDHFTKPQRKNIETWQKMTQEFNSLKEEFHEKFYNEDTDFNGFNNNRPDHYIEEIHQLKRENESLQFQLEAYKNEVDVIKADAQKEMVKFKAQHTAKQALGDTFNNKKMPTSSSSLSDNQDSKLHMRETVEVEFGEAKLIGVMSAFLQVHPQGASLDYLVSYVRAVLPDMTQTAIHNVLQKHDDVFHRITNGVGANIEHKWYFVALQHKYLQNKT